MSKSVMLEWTEELSFMQQSVLITAVRGADGLPKRHLSKYLLRWLRRCIMYSAFDKVVLSDPHDLRGGNFTGPVPRRYRGHKSMAQLTTDYLNDIDEVPHHFHLHLVHAAEILGYKHPTAETRNFWYDFYLRAVEDMHMSPETEGDLDFRLGDNQTQWQTAGGEHLEDRG